MNSPGATGALSLLRDIIQWVKYIFTPLSLCAIVWFIWQARASLESILKEGQWPFLIYALLFWILGNLIAPLVTVYIFQFQNIEVAWLGCLKIHCSRLPAKYLPGGIWHSVGRANDYYKLGHDVKKIGLYFLMENLLLLIVTLGISAGLVEHFIGISTLRLFVKSLPILMALAILILPLGAKFFLHTSQPLVFGSYFKAVATLTIYWCLIGMAFTCYISAFTALRLNASMLEVAAIYIFSWSMGYLALFAPQGIGVSEFIAGSLLTEGDQVGQIVAFMIGFRFLILSADLASWASVMPLKLKT